MNAHVYEACARHGVSQLVSLGAGCGYPLQAPEPLRESSMFDGLPSRNQSGTAWPRKCFWCRKKFTGGNMICRAPSLSQATFTGSTIIFRSLIRVIPALVRKFCEVRHGIADKVSVWGDGSASRDFIDAYDVGRAIMLCVQHKVTGVYNVDMESSKPLARLLECSAKFLH